jgi:hypothetical protein
MRLNAGSKGYVVPLTIVFKGKVHIKGWFEELGLPGDWRIKLSANGWTTNQITLRWLQKCFIPYTTKRTIGSHRLLVLDGHGSHLAPESTRFAEIIRLSISVCLRIHHTCFNH